MEGVTSVQAQHTRKLIWIPIVHAQGDLGSLSESVRLLHADQCDAAERNRRTGYIAEMWNGIRRGIDDLNLDYPRVRLYQDGLPVCGNEEEIVRDLARAGSLNHQILLELADKGAVLTGTESPDLLIKEYLLARQTLTSLCAHGSAAPAPEERQPANELLDKRDRYIVRRIDATLQPGEVGLVFLGLLHSLDSRLPQDVQLTFLSPNSPAAAER